ncbi:FapA family protein [Rummeliibacillus stabekisii]|uniref:Flagellar Assembly Protein A N-terminal region domain-containing protein n=1 Tax=Rummeliibacillus stabekisii TaxID=241244 RepID=A0A143HAV6_9BACL|nr:FapA family protein [Rummeliibacillus stabekisii]AMW98857.1 hypothetical protein ATY39_04975 [Rummeliibacillus stabekisii]
MVLFENDWIMLTEKEAIVYVVVKKEGYSLKEFEPVLKKFKRIKLNGFQALQSVFLNCSKEEQEIGYWLPPIEIVIARDGMAATMYINDHPATLFQDELMMNKQIKEAAENAGVQYGYLTLSLETVLLGKPTVIAKGQPPQTGEDAKITYKSFPKKKPQILDNGRANHYDINFIQEVKKDEWLGEKIPAKKGIPGKSVLGQRIEAMDGKDFMLVYDEKSIYEKESSGIVTIHALFDGVIEHPYPPLSVQKHLQIPSDVGVETGNLEFTGSITIRGTILPGFTVKATGDILIESKEGVTGAELIQSTHGDVYVCGGIYGNKITKVMAGQNIYVQYTNDCYLAAKETIFISTYAISTDMKAQNIRVDENKGKLIGGRICAKNSIHAAWVGNQLGRKTDLIISLPDRKDSLKKIKEKSDEIENLEHDLKDLRGKLAQLHKFLHKMMPAQRQTYDKIASNIKEKESQIEIIEYEIDEILHLLKSSGNEKISITKAAYPETTLQIGSERSTIQQMTKGEFKLESGVLNV